MCYGQRVVADDSALRLSRVWAVVQAGRRIADPRDPLGKEARERLPKASGLTPQGVELALSRHLETAPSATELERLLARASLAPVCHVLLAANVCTAALRSLAVAFATAPIVRIRPSRRDPVLAELLVRALGASAELARAGGKVEPCSELDVRDGDEVHLQGSDETLAAVRAALPAGARIRTHGTGIGLAVVDAEQNPETAARAITEDVVAFDQRGCLSPRFVLAGGEPRRARALAGYLHEALASAQERVPRGPLGPSEAAAVARYGATFGALGPCHEGRGHLVTVDDAPQTLLLGPAARVVPVVHCDAPLARQLLAPWTSLLTAVGAGTEPGTASAPGSLATELRALVPEARHSLLGWMQRPPLDGPVDLRAAAEPLSG